MGLSFSHILLVLVVLLVVFGAGKLPTLMSDLAKGLKSFKDGMSDDEPQSEPQKQITHKDDA